MRKGSLLIATFVVLFCCVASFAEYVPEKPLQWNPAIHRETLDNGMQIFLRENHKPENRLEIRLVVKAGSIYEEDGTEGLAHFLEHMAFNGTTHFKQGEIVKYLESVGAEFGPDNNAYTSWDKTVYILRLPSEDMEVLKTGMTIMADYMTGILFEPEEIEKERGVVLEEIRLRQGVESRVMRKAVSIAAKGSRWDSPRLTVVGDKETVENITRDDFLKFYRRWYRPDRLALVMVGDITVEAMRKLVEEFIEPVEKPEGEPEFPEYGIPDHDEIFTGIITDRELPTGGGGFVFVQPRKPTLTEGDYRQDRIELLVYSRLNDRLRELKETDDPPFLEGYISSYGAVPWLELRGGGAVTLQAKREKRALQAVIREMERAKRHGFLESEIQEELREREENSRQRLKEKDKQFSYALTYPCISAFLNGSVSISEEEDYRLIREVAPTITEEDVKQKVNELMAPVNVTLLLALPSYQKKLYKKDDILAWYEEVLGEDITAYEREELKKGTDYAGLKTAKIVEREELDKVEATRVKFDNGLVLYVKKTDFQEDEIQISSYNPYRAGLEETWRTYGITRIMQRLWWNGGTEEFKDSEIERLQKGKSFYISPGMSFSGWSINRDLEEAFQWMYDFMLQPGFRKEALKILKEEIRTELKNDKLDQDAAYSRAISEIMCPGDKGAVFIDDEDYYEQFDTSQIREWWGRVFHPAVMQFTLVGNLDVEKTIELAARYIGSLPGGEVPEPPALLTHCPFPTGYTRREVYRGMEDKTRVSIYLPGPKWDSDDYPPARVMSKIVDMRLLDHIREALGGTYYSYIYASSNPYVDGRDYISIGFASDPDRVEELLDEVDGVLAKFVQEGPTEKEMSSAREVFRKDREEDLKRDDFWMSVMNGAEYRPQPLTWRFDLYDRVMAVNAEQVKAVAEKWLTPPTDRIEVIAYKERKPEEEGGQGEDKDS